MQVSRDHIIFIISAITIVFLVSGIFLLVYVSYYNKRKRKHSEEKDTMRRAFDEELTKTQMEVQEQTLQTIASDIHDNVGQLLSLTKLTLSSVNMADPVKAGEKINNSIELVKSSMKALRQLAAILHAENLMAKGFEHAVSNEVNWLSRSERFKVDWVVEGSPYRTMDPKKEMIAFRLVQEALNNAIKHADASEISITLSYGEDGIKISIVDNGRGFIFSKEDDTFKGLGIRNFYNRTKMIQGKFDIISESGKGTTITFDIPY